MVIHHDKMAYGKIKPLKEDIEQSRLAAMAKKLSAAEAEKEAEAEAEAEKELSAARAAAGDADKNGPEAATKNK